MKFAVAAQSPDLTSQVAPAFGRARYFFVVDVESGRYDVHNNASHINAHHAAGIVTAGAVIELDVDAVATGNIGPNAFATLRAGFVEIFTGVTGTVEEAIIRFKSGQLEPAPLANVEGHWKENPVTHHKQLSAVARERAQQPRNYGPIQPCHGHAEITGSCGDTMEFWIRVTDDRITDIGFTTSGCASSRAAGSIATELARGQTLRVAAHIEQADILGGLGGLPAESEHCALLASNTLKAAIQDFPGRELPIAPKTVLGIDRRTQTRSSIRKRNGASSRYWTSECGKSATSWL